jgi:hypothetical protein
MSIYSGFGTRQQETNYNKAVYNLLYLMQLKISRNNKSCKQILSCQGNPLIFEVSS